MNGIFRSTIFLSLATFLNRILGLLRDLLLSRILGGGLLMSAWSFAWLVPNMFRRILGEGALGTALVPILTDTLEKQGVDSARKKFSTVMLWLFFLLAAITVLLSAGALIACCFIDSERWQLALFTIPVIMPYCILICSIGVFTSVLNTFRIFFLPAVMGLLPNIFMIGTVYFLLPDLMDSPLKALRVISVAMLLSGLIELIFLAIYLKKKNMLPEISKKILLNFSAVHEVWEKVLPGLIGAGALQIGTLVDGSLAMYIGDHAKAAMYYSDRLVYLPIGLFGVAFGTVSLPLLSKYVAGNRMKSMLIASFASMRQLLFIAIPMAVLTVMFSKELLAFLFLGGKFDNTALNEAHQAMFWYAIGIPFFCLTKLTVNTFYCRKNMKTPAIVSICCIGLNIILSAILMFPMKQGGITLATAFTSALHNILLLWILKKELGRMPLWGTVKFSAIILFFSGISGVAAYYSHKWILCHPEYHFLPRGIVPLMVAGGAFLFVYIVLCFVFRIHELRNVYLQIKNKLRRKK